jgi:uncharacterized protein
VRFVELAVLREELMTLLGAIVFGLIATWIALRCHFFKPVGIPNRPLPKGRHVAISFVLFVSVLWAAVVAAVVWPSSGWTPLISLLGLAGAGLLVGSYILAGTPVWSYLAAGSMRAVWSDLGRGALIWLIAFPWVIVVSKVCTLVALWLYGHTGPGQTAVRYLEALKGHPWMLGISLVIVVVIAPWLEELLFRGLLQSWLRRYLGAGWAIAVASAIFALCHYAPAQGIGNYEIVFSLALFGAFLGYVFEKYESLWVPIGLHMTFNLTGALLALTDFGGGV